MARDDDDDDDDRPRKKRRRDDDDDDADDEDRPRSKSRRDEDDEDDAFEDSDRPRRKSRRDEDDDEDDDERPRKKRKYDEDDEDDDDDRRVKRIKKKATPGMLLAAGIVAIAWGGLALLSSCGTSGKAFNDWNSLRQAEQIFGGMIRFAGVTPGLFLTLGIVYGVMVLACALLCVGGILLLMRKKIGKYLAIAGPVLMCLVALIGFVVGIIVTRGGLFATGALMGLPVMVFFTLCVGGFLIFALMQKDVVKALQ